MITLELINSRRNSVNASGQWVASAKVSICLLFACILMGNVACAQIPLINNGRINAVVVIADAPSKTATYAAAELVRHIEKATGQRLSVVAEKKIPKEYVSRIFVGVTRAARSQGIVPENLGSDEFLLRTIGRNLFIIGREKVDINPLGGIRSDNDRPPEEEVNGYSGTLFGVYDVLEHFVGVRWLWPGDLGTYVPRTRNLTIPAHIEKRQAPLLKYRVWHWDAIAYADVSYQSLKPSIRRLSFSREGVLVYRRDLEIYQRRHRCGNSEPPPRAAHTFHGWWNIRENEGYPIEWFQLRADGKRGAADGKAASSMCISNPHLQKYIVDKYFDGTLYVTGWTKERIGQALYLPISDADSRDFCHCKACQALDAPQPTSYPSEYTRDYRPLLSNRYARFWQTIYEMAAKNDPNVKVSAFLYWGTFPAPTNGVMLNKNIFGEFVPWTGPAAYYPMPDKADQWLKEQWLGWQKTGISLVYRPNLYHCGYVMPQLSTQQAGAFFKWAYRHGMVGVRFDSLFGHWAVRGPMLYLHMRLMSNPALEIESILKEYYSGFGPAAGLVEAYFSYWDKYCRSRPGGWLNNDVDQANIAFPPTVFPPAEKLLSSALVAAKGSPLPEFENRVRFLQAGLEHAKLSARFMASLVSLGRWNGSAVVDQVVNPVRFEESKRLLRELTKFRRDHELWYISDYLDASRRENAIVKNLESILDDVDIP